MTDVRRIVTTSSRPVQVGPRVSQWAYSLQPYRARGVHVQVRCESGRTHVEAVDAETGVLIAAAQEVVSLQRMDALRGMDSAAVVATRGQAATGRSILPLAA